MSQSLPWPARSLGFVRQVLLAPPANNYFVPPNDFCDLNLIYAFCQPKMGRPFEKHTCLAAASIKKKNICNLLKSGVDLNTATVCQATDAYKNTRARPTDHRLMRVQYAYRILSDH